MRAVALIGDFCPPRVAGRVKPPALAGKGRQILMLTMVEGTPLEMDMRSLLAKIAESLRGNVSLDIESLTEQFTVISEDHAIVEPQVWQAVARVGDDEMPAQSLNKTSSPSILVAEAGQNENCCASPKFCGFSAQAGEWPSSGRASKRTQISGLPASSPLPRSPLLWALPEGSPVSFFLPPAPQLQPSQP